MSTSNDVSKLQKTAKEYALAQWLAKDDPDGTGEARTYYDFMSGAETGCASLQGEVDALKQQNKDLKRGGEYRRKRHLKYKQLVKERIQEAKRLFSQSKNMHLIQSANLGAERAAKERDELRAQLAESAKELNRTVYAMDLARSERNKAEEEAGTLRQRVDELEGALEGLHAESTMLMRTAKIIFAGLESNIATVPNSLPHGNLKYQIPRTDRALAATKPAEQKEGAT